MVNTKQYQYFKYQADGNDMLVIDPAYFALDLNPARIRQLCDRHFGIGADGICYGPLPGFGSELHMRFLNPDGSEAEKSGNGLRCFGRYVWDAGLVPEADFNIYIGEHTISTRIMNENGTRIRQAIGQLKFDAESIPMLDYEGEMINRELIIAGHPLVIRAVNIGNPHCVIVSPPLDVALLKEIGPLVEHAACFPQRTNVQMLKIIDRHNIQIEIWERGAGYTLASGTSSSACAGAAVRGGDCDSPVTVHMAGGSAQVELDEQYNVFLTGKVNSVMQGTLSRDLATSLEAQG